MINAEILRSEQTTYSISKCKLFQNKMIPLTLPCPFSPSQPPPHLTIWTTSTSTWTQPTVSPPLTHTPESHPTTTWPSEPPPHLSQHPSETKPGLNLPPPSPELTATLTWTIIPTWFSFFWSIKVKNNLFVYLQCIVMLYWIIAV